jgi:Xaa-Pro dipeptidase
VIESDIPEIRPGCESAFRPEEYEARLSAARAALMEAKLDVLIVTSPENIFYLTGQQSPGYYMFQALVLPAKGEPSFVVRQLEYYNFRANTFIAQAEVFQDGEDPAQVLVGVLRNHDLAAGRIGIDKRGWFLSIALYEALQAGLGRLHDGSGIVEKLRAVKSSAEIQKLEIAAAYADTGMKAGLAAIAPGIGENDIAATILEAMVRGGTEYLAMEPLVTVAERTGLPHGMWRRRHVEKNGPVLLSIAGCRDRYHAAIMRTAWVGDVPADVLDMEKTCQEALDAALDAIRPGSPCEAAHIACQHVIDRDGYTDNFRKRTGYSMGIAFAPDWGEGSVLSLYSGVQTELRPGMVFHVPVALRVFGRLTVAVSETVLVTDSGCRALGSIPRPLLRIAA